MLELLEQVVLDFGYVGIGFLLFLEHLFPPFPAQLALPFMGILVEQGKLSFIGVWLSSSTGGIIGSYVLYEFGRWADQHLMRRFVRRYGRWLGLKERDLDRALTVFTRYGAVIIFGSHIIPMSIFRSALAMMAGANRMPRLRFLLYAGLGTLAWMGGQLYAIVLIGENWALISRTVQKEPEITGAIVALVVILVLLWWRRRMVERITRRSIGAAWRLYRRLRLNAEMSSSSGL